MNCSCVPEMDPEVLPRLRGALVGEQGVFSCGAGVSSLGGGEEGGWSGSGGEGSLWNIGSRSINTCEIRSRVSENAERRGGERERERRRDGREGGEGGGREKERGRERGD